MCNSKSVKDQRSRRTKSISKTYIIVTRLACNQDTSYRKDTDPLYHYFMFSLISLLSGTCNAFIACYILVINYLPRCSYHFLTSKGETS